MPKPTITYDQIVELINLCNISEHEKKSLVNELEENGLNDLLRMKLLTLFKENSDRLGEDIKVTKKEQEGIDQKIQSTQKEVSEGVSKDYANWLKTNRQHEQELSSIKKEVENRMDEKGYPPEDADVEEVEKILKP